MRIFGKQRDFEAFEEVIAQAKQRLPMRVLAWCVMNNHWHFALWPRGDGDLSEFMRWLTVTHTQRWHAAHRTSGTGPLYQGRFKSFPVQEDDHLWTVLRYVERNPLRANLVERADAWRWSSLWHRADGSRSGVAAPVGPSRRAVRRGLLAAAHREAIEPPIHPPPPRPPLAVARQVEIKTPDPFTPSPGV